MDQCCTVGCEQLACDCTWKGRGNGKNYFEDAISMNSDVQVMVYNVLDFKSSAKASWGRICEYGVQNEFNAG